MPVRVVGVSETESHEKHAGVKQTLNLAGSVTRSSTQRARSRKRRQIQDIETEEEVVIKEFFFLSSPRIYLLI